LPALHVQPVGQVMPQSMVLSQPLPMTPQYVPPMGVQETLGMQPASEVPASISIRVPATAPELMPAVAPEPVPPVAPAPLLPPRLMTFVFLEELQLTAAATTYRAVANHVK
jgi:hypothetical protein